MDWLYFFLAVVSAICLYWLRCKYRWAYGAIEIVVALALVCLAIFPEGPIVLVTDNSLIPSPSEQYLKKILTLLAAVYVFIRGLDNLDTGLSTTSWGGASWGQRWARLKQWAPACARCRR
jgi:hypothetical protein